METILFFIGGAIYILIELLWRGHTHWTMFILGGLCFVIVGLLNEYVIKWHWCLLRQSVFGAVVITLLEYISGYNINIKLGWGVWDYSALPFNLHGQICLYFFLLWISLAAVAIIVDDWIRYGLYIMLHDRFPGMQERKRPDYKII